MTKTIAKQSKIKILATGLNGLVGSKIKKDLANKYSFFNIDHADPVNPVSITDLEQLRRAFAASQAEVVIHLAAFTDVNAAWQQRNDKNGAAYQVNVVGTQNVVRAAQENGQYLIHISTAYVFDGEKSTLYQETDRPHPIEWYGQTKLAAEEAVQNSDLPWAILRIDQPFRSDSFPKIDIAHRIIDGLRNNNLYPQFTDHYFSPTFIDDFVKIIDFFIQQRPRGIFHSASGEKFSDYHFARLIKEKLNLPGKIEPGSLKKYLQTLQRPYQKNTALDNGKLLRLLDFPLLPMAAAVKKINLENQ